MKQCLFVESRDPADHGDVERMATLALGMARRGCPSALLLIENGVFAVREGVAPWLQDLSDAGVALAADRLSLMQRGIDETAMPDGVVAAEPTLVVDQLEAGAAVIWN